MSWVSDMRGIGGVQGYHGAPKLADSAVLHTYTHRVAL